MTAHVFVDETKQRDFVLAAAVVHVNDLDVVCKTIRNLLAPGQRRLHMKSERDTRRRLILSTLATTSVTLTIYNAGGSERTQIARRLACLRALVNDAATNGHRMLVLERDDTLVPRDRQALIEYVRATGCHRTIRYEHRRAHEEQLLAIPDAIAWTWSKGGDWRRRTAPMVTAVKNV